jgi:hypothetical protein
MNRSLVTLFAVLALALGALGATPTRELSAGGLQSYCRYTQMPTFTVPAGTSKKEVPNMLMRYGHESGACDGFMIGWGQALSAATVRNGKGKPLPFGLVEGVTIGQMERVFVAYMAKHPEKENELASLGVFDAMLDAGLIKQ